MYIIYKYAYIAKYFCDMNNKKKLETTGLNISYLAPEILLDHSLGFEMEGAFKKHLVKHPTPNQETSLKYL